MAGLWLSVGNLNNGDGYAGLSCVNANNGLTNGRWNILARISEINMITSRRALRGLYRAARIILAAAKIDQVTAPRR
mgnify:CR=1 FL=1